MGLTGIFINFLIYKYALIMWFLSGVPKTIEQEVIVKSVKPGYQYTNIRFRIGSDDEKLTIAIVFPWSANKENGSFKHVAEQTEDSICSDDILINNSDNIYSNFRKLKFNMNYKLSQIQELNSIYIDDFGLILFDIIPDKWYRLNYKHKIAADSQLFCPTHLSAFTIAQQPQIKYHIRAIDVVNFETPKHLINISSHGPGSLYKVNTEEFKWDMDTRFNTTNWESSDDE